MSTAAERDKARRLARRIEADARALLDLIAPGQGGHRDLPPDFGMNECRAIDQIIAGAPVLSRYVDTSERF